mmetsp:Transcript_6958/g.11141  ORF Transcript_6958/g.11141 Transcript_6958/m.11141 type:complete len:213 (-) Transcript_6958:400-1038(-)
MYIVDDVDTVHHNSLVLGGSQRRVQHGPPLSVVDLVPPHHGFYFPLEPGFVRQLEQHLHGALSHLLAAVVQDDPVVLDVQRLRAVLVLEQLAQVCALHHLRVRPQHLPLLRLADRRPHGRGPPAPVALLPAEHPGHLFRHLLDQGLRALGRPAGRAFQGGAPARVVRRLPGLRRRLAHQLDAAAVAGQAGRVHVVVGPLPFAAALLAKRRRY